MFGSRMVVLALGLAGALLPADIAAAQGKGAAARAADHRRAGRRLLRQRPALDLRHHAADLPRRLPRRGRLLRLHLQHQRERLLPQVRRRRPHPLPGRPLGDPRPAARRPRRARRRAGGRPRLPRRRRASPPPATRRSPPASRPPRRSPRPPVAAELAALRRDVNATDSAAAWSALAGYAAGAEVEDWSQNSEVRDLAVAAGINAFLRAATDAEAGEAARLTGVALEAAGDGRASLDALRLAESLAPGPAIAAAVERAEGLYGFRVTDRQVDFEAASPRACFTFSDPLAASASTTPTSSASTPAPSRSRPATASSASTASPTAAATR